MNTVCVPRGQFLGWGRQGARAALSGRGAWWLPLFPSQRPKVSPGGSATCGPATPIGSCETRTKASSTCHCPPEPSAVLEGARPFQPPHPSVPLQNLPSPPEGNLSAPTLRISSLTYSSLGPSVPPSEKWEGIRFPLALRVLRVGGQALSPKCPPRGAYTTPLPPPSPPTPQILWRGKRVKRRGPKSSPEGHRARQHGDGPQGPLRPGSRPGPQHRLH